MPDMVSVRCPAKVNLFLEVLGKRADEYHEIVTVMAPISLYDTIEMAPSRGRDALVVMPKGAAPTDASNTVLKAIASLRKRCDMPPVRIRLAKRIPSGAGLGGGSSDAAGAVRAANRLFKLGMSVGGQAGLLALVGSDTAFFAHGAWAVCRGRGEQVTPLDEGRAVPLIIVVPPFENSTAEVYKRHREEGAIRSVDTFLDAWRRGRKLTGQLFNRLERAAFEYRPELPRLKKEMQQLQFADVVMTGSGSAVVGLCKTSRDQLSLAKAARERSWGHVFAVRTLV